MQLITTVLYVRWSLDLEQLQTPASAGNGTVRTVLRFPRSSFMPPSPCRGTNGDAVRGLPLHELPCPPGRARMWKTAAHDMRRGPRRGWPQHDRCRHPMHRQLLRISVGASKSGEAVRGFVGSLDRNCEERRPEHRAIPCPSSDA